MHEEQPEKRRKERKSSRSSEPKSKLILLQKEQAFQSSKTKNSLASMATENPDPSSEVLVVCLGKWYLFSASWRRTSTDSLHQSHLNQRSQARAANLEGEQLIRSHNKQRTKSLNRRTPSPVGHASQEPPQDPKEEKALQSERLDPTIQQPSQSSRRKDGSANKTCRTSYTISSLRS